MRLLILISLLFLSGCATCPAPQTIEVPVAVQAKHIEIAPCPMLPLISIPFDAPFDVHLKAWDASIVILRGCVNSRDRIIEELNK